MEFMDLQILELRRQQKKSQTLEDELYIEGERIEFMECQLFDDCMEITLPSTFVDMPLKIAKIKYPSENRPHVIKTNLLGTINFAFNMFQQEVKPDDIKEIAKSFEDVIRKVNPANIFYNRGTEMIGNTKLSFFDFKGYAIDTQIYYIYYVTSIGGRLLHGIFSCKMEDREDYKDIAFMVMRSIKDLTGGNEDA